MTMSVSDQSDALADLSDSERQQLAHWEKQFAGIDCCILIRAEYTETVHYYYY